MSQSATLGSEGALVQANGENVTPAVMATKPGESTAHHRPTTPWNRSSCGIWAQSSSYFIFSDDRGKPTVVSAPPSKSPEPAKADPVVPPCAEGKPDMDSKEALPPPEVPLPPGEPSANTNTTSAPPMGDGPDAPASPFAGAPLQPEPSEVEEEVLAPAAEPNLQACGTEEVEKEEEPDRVEVEPLAVPLALPSAIPSATNGLKPTEPEAEVAPESPIAQPEELQLANGLAPPGVAEAESPPQAVPESHESPIAEPDVAPLDEDFAVAATPPTPAEEGEDAPPPQSAPAGETSMQGECEHAHVLPSHLPGVGLLSSEAP